MFLIDSQESISYDTPEVSLSLQHCFILLFRIFLRLFSNVLFLFIIFYFFSVIFYFPSSFILFPFTIFKFPFRVSFLLPVSIYFTSLHSLLILLLYIIFCTSLHHCFYVPSEFFYFNSAFLSSFYFPSACFVLPFKAFITLFIYLQ